MTTDGMLQVAAQHYEMKLEQAKLLKGYSNQIYECGDKIFQFTAKQYKSSEEIGMELAWMNFLRSKGVNVAEVISSKRGKTFEELENGLLVCYRKINGKKISRSLWSAQHVQQLGKLTGQLHRWGKVFQASTSFSIKHWHEIPKAKIEADLPKDERKLPQLHEHLKHQFHAYPINTEAYGLIHYDIHHGNYLIAKEQKIVLFDFEMACQSWYAHEIGTVLYYALFLPMMQAKKEADKWFLKHFLKGYSKEHTIAPQELDKIPAYLLYRDLLVYAYISKVWSEENITEAQEVFREQIEQGILERRECLGL
ncbi:MAG: phosphotransferase [Bacteroidota bacterium]